MAVTVILCVVVISAFVMLSNAAGETCGQAELLTYNGAARSGTTIGAATDMTPQCGIDNSDQPFPIQGVIGGGQVWYKFTGNGKNTFISTCNSYTDFDTQIQVFSGTCGSLVCVGGSDDAPFTTCSPYQAGFPNTQGTFTPTLGVEYYVVVMGWGTESGNFRITLTDNSICTDVDNFDLQYSTTYSGTTIGQVNTMTMYPYPPYNVNGQVYYTFPGTSGGSSTVTVCSTNFVAWVLVKNGGCAGSWTDGLLVSPGNCYTVSACTDCNLNSCSNIVVSVSSFSYYTEGDFTIRMDRGFDSCIVPYIFYSNPVEGQYSQKFLMLDQSAITEGGDNSCGNGHIDPEVTTPGTGTNPDAWVRYDATRFVTFAWGCVYGDTAAFYDDKLYATEYKNACPSSLPSANCNGMQFDNKLWCPTTPGGVGGCNKKRDVGDVAPLSVTLPNLVKKLRDDKVVTELRGERLISTMAKGAKPVDLGVVGSRIPAEAFTAMEKRGVASAGYSTVGAYVFSASEMVVGEQTFAALFTSNSSNTYEFTIGDCVEWVFYANTWESNGVRYLTQSIELANIYCTGIDFKLSVDIKADTSLFGIPLVKVFENVPVDGYQGRDFQYFRTFEGYTAFIDRHKFSFFSYPHNLTPQEAVDIMSGTSPHSADSLGMTKAHITLTYTIPECFWNDFKGDNGKTHGYQGGDSTFDDFFPSRHEIPFPRVTLYQPLYNKFELPEVSSPIEFWPNSPSSEYQEKTNVMIGSIFDTDP